ncbi:MAG: hypothetical protein AAF679_04915 [Pseudomonadota bacterium]
MIVLFWPIRASAMVLEPLAANGELLEPNLYRSTAPLVDFIQKDGDVF